MAETDDLRIVLNTPFTPRPAPAAEIRGALARAGRSPLPYTLDLWEGKAKTFSVAWSDNQLRVTIFKRGPWIDRLRLRAQIPHDQI